LPKLHVLGLKDPFAYIDPWEERLAQYDGKIVECSYVIRTNKWIVDKVRTDKNRPNAYQTANSVLLTARQHIPLNALLDYIAIQVKSNGEERTSELGDDRKKAAGTGERDIKK